MDGLAQQLATVMNMTRRLAALVLAALALADCSRGPSPAEAALKRTADNLSRVHSGVLGFRLVNTAAGQPGTGTGLEVDGPFSASQGGAPLLDLTYTPVG